MPIFDPALLSSPLFDPAIPSALTAAADETWRAALVNSFAEVPPLCQFPRRERLTLDWSEGGDHCQKTWSHAQLTRYLISGKEELHQFTADGLTQITAAVAGPPTDWYVSSHQLAVDNDETDQFIIKAGSTEIATASPYHSYLGVYGVGEDTEATGNVWHDQSNGGRHVRGYISAGFLQIQRSSNTQPFVWDLLPDRFECDWSTGRFQHASPSEPLYVIYDVAGEINLGISYDHGETWQKSEPIPIAVTGAKPTMVISRHTGKRYLYWLDGSDIKGTILDSADNVLEATFTAVSGVDDAGIAAMERVYHDGTNPARHQIVLTYLVGGVVTESFSDDGNNF